MDTNFEKKINNFELLYNNLEIGNITGIGKTMPILFKISNLQVLTEFFFGD